jgi:hypothetical protein
MQDRAIAKIGSIRNGKPLRFVFLGICDPLPMLWVWDWVALGWPKRGPSVAQGRRKRRVGEMSLFATKTRKWRAGVARKARLSPESHVIGRSPTLTGD